VVRGRLTICALFLCYDDALFGYNVGPHSWKKYLFPLALRTATARWEH
jgi:hypothetical protein